MELFRKKYMTNKVFTPGGLPDHTYVGRKEKGIEDKLIDALSALNKLIMITGLTKSGKSVMTKTTLKHHEVVWCDCGSFSQENDLWEYILAELNGFTSISYSKSETKIREFSLSVRTTSFFIFSWLGFGGKRGRKRTSGVDTTRTVSAKTEALRLLKYNKTPIILDDFHYLKRDLQGSVVRAFKGLIFSGLPVICIAIPHRRLDAVKVEREMTGRVEPIDIPIWEHNELVKIPQKGFPLLNIDINNNLYSDLAQEAFGSPHLMQEFCLAICKNKKIDKTSRKKVIIDSIDNKDQIFSDVAEGTGKLIYDKLAKGPRQRSDRIKRPLVSGREVDIYEVILLSLVELKPGLSTVTYEELRDTVRRILTDKIPNVQEISRVLDNMSKIALTDESSTPVLDWEKEESRLHITDPFFAFYLKWGKIEK